jgi:glycosyltransferase involved in cell wall biosynthesis
MSSIAAHGNAMRSCDVMIDTLAKGNEQAMEDVGGVVRRKINILFVIDYFHETGGTEKHLTQLVLGLPRDTFACSVVVFDMGVNTLIEEMRAAGVPVHHIPVRRIYTPSALWRAAALARIMRRGRVDIVQTFHQTSDTLGAAVAKLCGVRHIISSKRDTGQLKRPLHIFLNRRLKFLFERFIVVADAVGQAVVTSERLDQSRIVRIYNGVDTVKFSPPRASEAALARKRLGFSDSDYVVGMVAAFRPEKNYDTFFEGVVKAMPVIPSLKVLAIGGGPLLEHFRARYEIDRFRSRIVFTGGVGNVTRYLEAMDVGCLIPGKNEGFSNAVLEKMAMGLPMIVTDVGGNAEAVINGENGMVIPPADPDAFRAALISLHSDTPRRLAMGRRSRQLAEERFSLRDMYSNHEILYRSLLGHETEVDPL